MAVQQDILEFIGERWVVAFGKKKAPTQPMRLIRPMTENGWRPVTPENPITFAPKTINALLMKCCSHDPTARPSFAQVVAELEGACEEEIGKSLGFWSRRPAPAAGAHAGEVETDFEEEDEDGNDALSISGDIQMSYLSGKETFGGIDVFETNPSRKQKMENDAASANSDGSVGTCSIDDLAKRTTGGGAADENLFEAIEEMFDSEGNPYFLDRAQGLTAWTREELEKIRRLPAADWM
jgi:hypothetical protein